MKKFISLAVTSLMLLLASNTASAVPINGVINFVGGAVITNTPTEISTIAFYNPSSVSNIPALVTGDFASAVGAPATFYDFNASTPSTMLWSAGDFTFTITNVTFNTYTSGISGTKNVGGTGIITSTNSLLDATSGQWIITANGDGSGNVSFSSTAIPAPAGAALLGLSLLGFGFARRNKKAK